MKRLLTLCLALAFMLAVTAQLMPFMPFSMADPQLTVSVEMAGGCAGPQAPCTGHMPNCVDHIGCVTVSALPTSQTSIAVAFEWTTLGYDLAPEALTGISVKPELSPPILAA